MLTLLLFPPMINTFQLTSDTCLSQLFVSKTKACVAVFVMRNKPELDIPYP